MSLTVEHQKVGFMVPIDGVDNEFAIGNGPSVGFYTWNGVSSDPLVARAFMTTGQDEFNVNSGKADERGRLWVGECYIQLSYAIRIPIFYSVSRDQHSTVFIHIYMLRDKN